MTNSMETPSPSASRATLAWGALAALFTFVWFAQLGMRSLITTDEGRYATIALNMLQSGDWVTPRLNGLLYFEKPVLQYWIGALAFQLFGVSEFSARLWPGLAGFLTVAAVGFTAARLWGRDAGIRAFAIAGSMIWIVSNARFLSLDAGLSFFLTLALCAVLLAEGNPEASAATRRRWIWLAWAAMAGAVLSKGLIGVAIPGGVLFLACLWRRDFRLWRGMHWFSGLLIFFALTAPWFVLVSLRNPGFAEFFFIHEHFARYLSTTHRREGEWWYYLPWLLAGMLPWTLALPWLFRAPRAGEGERTIKAHHLLLVWSVFIFVFFSYSGSKLPSYILPILPALALLAALRLREARPAALGWFLLAPALLWALALAASTQVDRLAMPNTPADLLVPMIQAVRWGALIFLAGAILSLWSLRKKCVTAAIVSLAFGHFLATILLIQSYDHYGQLRSADKIARALTPLIGPETPVFSVGVYDHTLPFYLRRNVTLVAYVSEFAFGQAQEPERWIRSLDDFARQWKALPQAAAYMSPSLWTELSQRGLPMHIVYQDPRRLMVVKSPRHPE